MNRPRRAPARRLGSALAAVGLLTTLVAGTVPTANAAEPPPAPQNQAPQNQAPQNQAPARPVQADCDGVRLAPVLPDDLDERGQPIRLRPDPRRNSYVPVLMVPDWIGSAHHDASRSGTFSKFVDLSSSGPLPAGPRRSMIGTIQNVPGTAVYTWDYPDEPIRWVNDPKLGPALGEAIDCLSTATGQKVVVVAQGYGGLIARWAAANAPDRDDRLGQISDVVTFGSAQAGAELAELLRTGVGFTASEPRQILSLMLGACRAVDPESLGVDAPCRSLPAQAGAIATAQGQSIQAGSGKLALLPPYPTGLRVHAMIGETRVTVPQLGWFGLTPFQQKNLNVGDLVTTAQSAENGSLTETRANCSYGLTAYGDAGQAPGLGLQPPGDPTVFPLASSPSPCFHGNLPRTVDFATEMADIMRTEVRSRSPLELGEVLSGEAPALCGFNGGRFVNGRLPGIPPGQGEVALAPVLFPDRKDDFLRFGDITGDGVDDVVVVAKCATANGPGPDAVLVYDSLGTLIGTVRLESVTDSSATSVYEIGIDSGEGTVTFTSPHPTDAEGSTYDWSARFDFSADAGKVVGESVERYDAEDVAALLRDAVRAGERKKALNYADPAVVDAMLTADSQAGGLGDLDCYGPTPKPDPNWPQPAIDQYGAWPPADGARHGSRFCIIDLDGSPVALLGMEHRGYRDWVGVEFLYPEPTTEDVEPTPGDGEPTSPPGDFFPNPFPSPGTGDDDNDNNNDDGDSLIPPLF